MNMDRIKFRYWEHEVWDDPTSPLVARYANAANDCIIEILESYLEFISLARFGMLAMTNPELSDGERKRGWRTFKKMADQRKSHWESLLAHAQAAKELANA